MVPLLICLVCLMGGCVWWLFRRCLHSGSTASKDWPPATYDEFKDVPRICRILLSVYEEDINNPVYNDRLEIQDVVRLAGYKDTQGRCPPYVIYVDHAARDICLAVRGLNMANFADYRVLMDNRIGKQRFDGGYVHHGLLKSAAWLLDQEMETLNALAAENPEYTVTLAGHSLGSGIVAMMTVILHKNPDEVGFDNARLRCFCIAPARSTSLNLAIKYADIINSVVLQDDFLPRTSAPIDNILALSFCLPCMLCVKCCWDTCGCYKRRVKDPRRLYAPGRLFHILYTSDFSCKEGKPQLQRGGAAGEDGRASRGPCQEEEPQVETAVPIEDHFIKYPLPPPSASPSPRLNPVRHALPSCQEEEPQVKTAVPVEDRFEKVVLSRTAIDDHSIVIIERRSTVAVESLELREQAEEEEEETAPPSQQRMHRSMQRSMTSKERQQQYAQALERALTLHVPDAASAEEIRQLVAAAEAREEEVSERAVHARRKDGMVEKGKEDEKEEKRGQGEKGEGKEESKTVAPSAAAGAVAAVAVVGMQGGKEAVGGEKEAERKKEEDETSERSAKSETLSEFWQKELEEFREKERQALLEEERKAEERVRQFEEQSQAEKNKSRAEQAGREGDEEPGEEAESLSDYWSKELAALRRREEVAMVEREAQAAERIRAFEERQRVERARRAEEGEASERLSEFWGREMDGEKGEGEWGEREVEGEGDEEGAPADVAIRVDEGTAMLPQAPPPAFAPPLAAAAAAAATATPVAGAKGEKSKEESQGQQQRQAQLGRALTTAPQQQQQQQQQQRVEPGAARQQMGRAITVGSGREEEAAAARLSARGVGAGTAGGVGAGGAGAGKLSVRQKWARIVDELIDEGEGGVQGGTRDAAEAQLREAQRIGKEQWHKARAAFLSGVGGLSKKAGMNIEI
ncbi:unnamed protein product [Closterium sp. Naga37s-1]|nr:unnamed protein product [Closterium sp. Naga37s-1]